MPRSQGREKANMAKYIMSIEGTGQTKDDGYRKNKTITGMEVMKMKKKKNLKKKKTFYGHAPKDKHIKWRSVKTGHYVHRPKGKYKVVYSRR